MAAYAISTSTAQGKRSAMEKPAQSSANLSKRLQQELMGLMMSSAPGITAFPKSDESLLEWTGKLDGPSGTVYEGLSYRISIVFGPDYPYSAPTIRFETPCYHPNTTLQGDICCDILKEEYSPALSVSALLLSLQSLFGEPNNRSPLNVEAADLWEAGDQAAFRREVLRHYKALE